LAKIRHDAIPEELRVKEVMVTKGLSQKRMRIMGRGRTGVGYMRKTHVRIVLEKINFQKHINRLTSHHQISKWSKRENLALTIKAKSKVNATK